MNRHNLSIIFMLMSLLNIFIKNKFQKRKKKEKETENEFKMEGEKGSQNFKQIQ